MSHVLTEEQKAEKGMIEFIVSALIWSIGMFIVFGIFLISLQSQTSIITINHTEYLTYTDNVPAYQTNWTDDTRNDAKYTRIMEEDEWLGKDLSKSNSPCIEIAVRTPNGCLYRLEKIDTITRDVPKTVKKISEDFDVNAYVAEWSEYKKNGWSDQTASIPDEERLREDAEFIKTKLTELAEDLAVCS